MADNDYFDDEENPFLSDDDDDDNEIRAGDYDEDAYDEDSSPPVKERNDSWLFSVVFALVPVAGLVYLFITMFKRHGEKSAWAKAALSTEIVIYMVALCIYAVKPDIIKIKDTPSSVAVANKEKRSDKKSNGGIEQEQKSTSSKKVSLSFSTGALITLQMPENYTKADDSSDGSSETITFTSGSGKMLIAVCISGAGSKDQVTEDSIKNLQPEGTKIKDFNNIWNKYFSISSYKKTAGQMVSYECACYGVKQDYVMITADEPIKVLSASYTN